MRCSAVEGATTNAAVVAARNIAVRMEILRRMAIPPVIGGERARLNASVARRVQRGDGRVELRGLERGERQRTAVAAQAVQQQRQIPPPQLRRDLVAEVDHL